MEGELPILPCATEVTTGDVGFFISIVVANSVDKVVAGTTNFVVGKVDWEISTDRDSSNGNVKLTFTCQKKSRSDYWRVSAIATVHFSTQTDDEHAKKTPPVKEETKIEVNSSHRSADIVLSKEKLLSLLPKDWKEQKEATYSIHVGVKLRMGKTCGLRSKTVFSYDFLSQSELSNLLLIIEGKSIFVDLQYLAHYSAFFAKYTRDEAIKKLEIDEKSKLPMLKLDGVNSDPFVEVLKIIYPCQSEVTNENCEKLLIVADFLRFETVLIKCESFLCGPRVNISILKKLQWAFVYQMSELQEYCINNLPASSYIVNLTDDPVYKELSCEVKSALLDHLTTLLKEKK